MAYVTRVARKLALRQMRCCVCLILFSFAAGRGAVGSVRDGEESKPAKSDDGLFYLDTINPSITQPLEARDGPLEGYKFVQVEITEVRNPRKVSLTFQLYCQSKNKEKVYLGSFSLYPSDNPGKFIVATQGKLKEKSAIILTMVMPDEVAPPRDDVRVTVKTMKLLTSSE